MADKNTHDISQSDILLNENTTRNTFNNEVTTVQDPSYDDNEIELQEAWTMEMQKNNSDILIPMMNGLKQAREDHNKFLYARAIHSNHVIQYHMQQIMEQRKVVDEYRSMMVEGIDLTTLESNLFKK